MKRKLWLAIYDEELQADMRWMVQADLSKPIRFVELRGERLGFTQEQPRRWWQVWKGWK